MTLLTKHKLKNVANFILLTQYKYSYKTYNFLIFIFCNAHILSFHIVSLFTNIPLDFTINLILERVHKNKKIDLLIPEHE